MNNILLILCFFIQIFNSELKKDDIFDLTNNLRFCGADLLSKKIPIYNNPKPNINKNKNRNRSLKTSIYHPMRIFVETTYFEYQGSLYPSLNEKVPLLKEALNGAVEGIKGLIEMEDIGDINLFSNVNPYFFTYNNIPRWSPIFEQGSNINSDFLIIVKFDTIHEFPQGVLASAIPIMLDSETNRPLVGLLTITVDESYFSMRRVVEYFKLVLLHELTHALGFLYTMFPYFPNGIEGTYKKVKIRNIERTIIKTKKVVEIAKKYFNCSNIEGVELEDQGGIGSALSHWEQRVLLGDYMGAVIYQEEMVVSEFTLALLEDTGWYKINYYTGGLMRYGKNRGCDFIYGDCLNESYNTNFTNEFFDSVEAYTPSCSAGRQSRTYSILNFYNQIMDSNYSNHFLYNQNYRRFSSGAMYTTDYCFTHGQRIDETNNGYFTGNCKYGIGSYGNNIYYFNSQTHLYEAGHPNSELPEDLGEVYSNTSFCIMSSLSPSGKYPLYSSMPHSMCYQIYCSSSSLSIRINNDFVVCPREGGNVKMVGYDGYIHCPDYNLMCSGTVVCNDVFDCIEKKSLVKESSYIYNYEEVTTQKYSKILEINAKVAYESADDGFCPQHCSQCDINKKCKNCQEGYNLIGDKHDDDKPIICDNTIIIDSGYYSYNNAYFKCNNECNRCQTTYNNCISCNNNYYFLENTNLCYSKENKPNGYYFNETSNKFISCHKNCETCSAGPISDAQMNCDSCKNKLKLKKNKNCIEEKEDILIYILIPIIIIVVLAIIGLGVYILLKKKKTINITNGKMIELGSKTKI